MKHMRMRISNRLRRCGPVALAALCLVGVALLLPSAASADGLAYRTLNGGCPNGPSLAEIRINSSVPSFVVLDQIYIPKPSPEWCSAQAWGAVVTADGIWVYITTNGQGVWAFNTVTRLLQSIDLSYGSFWLEPVLSPDEKVLYVTGRFGVSAFNTATSDTNQFQLLGSVSNEALASLSPFAGGQLFGADVTPDGETLYVAKGQAVIANDVTNPAKGGAQEVGQTRANWRGRLRPAFPICKPSASVLGKRAKPIAEPVKRTT